MVLFLTSADASAANGGGASMLVMMIVLIAVFYFFMIRPENKRKKEAQAMRDAIKVGDNITTIGGIIGDVVSVKDNSIVIETSDDRVRMELTKWSVSTNNSQQPVDKKAEKKAKAEEAAKEEPAKIPEGSDNEVK